MRLKVQWRKNRFIFCYKIVFLLQSYFDYKAFSITKVFFIYKYFGPSKPPYGMGIGMAKVHCLKSVKISTKTSQCSLIKVIITIGSVCNVHSGACAIVKMKIFTVLSKPVPVAQWLSTGRHYPDVLDRFSAEERPCYLARSHKKLLQTLFCFKTTSFPIYYLRYCYMKTFNEYGSSSQFNNKASVRIFDLGQVHRHGLTFWLLTQFQFHGHFFSRDNCAV